MSSSRISTSTLSSQALFHLPAEEQIDPTGFMTQSVSMPDNSTYAIATGERDKQRLTILNEVYNPFSLAFFRECNIPQGARLLELGCGVGLMSQELASFVGKTGEVLATDFSEEQINLARSLLPAQGNQNVRFQTLSAFEVDSLDQKFDVVYARFLFLHLKDHRTVVQKIKSVLKPGGKLIIEDSTGNETMKSIPDTEGMAILRRVDELQFEIQKTDHKYFSSLPQLLEEEGFVISALQHAQPKLTSERERSMITCISSLKDTVLTDFKIPPEEYDRMFRAIQELVQDTSVQIQYYELGQVCATLS